LHEIETSARKRTSENIGHRAAAGANRETREIDNARVDFIIHEFIIQARRFSRIALKWHLCIDTS